MFFRQGLVLVIGKYFVNKLPDVDDSHACGVRVAPWRGEIFQDDVGAVPKRCNARGKTLPRRISILPIQVNRCIDENDSSRVLHTPNGIVLVLTPVELEVELPDAVNETAVQEARVEMERSLVRPAEQVL
jgi:hypothetical protein